ncbi:hypothetical protein KC19_10G007000 [Ceratodon purpureus]|uniref:t-SNARE coiled-coil homology domain-containing protein n=1 Tax=Ceratodon purpureus TaxID=3225 RepID=A0A8T0GIQ3_CERPU|nr:hypothetical protein KC19_10G007000 [Ceratodon purpureus]
MASAIPPQLASLEKEVLDIFKILSTGFQRLDKIKDAGRQSKQLEELTAKMREAKRMIKEFDREIKEEATPETTKLLTEKKQSLIRELNSYVGLRKTYTSSIGNKQELLDGGSFSGGPARDVDVRIASTMSNQELIETGKKQMDETDQTIERSKKVVEDTISIGAETSTTLKEQTEQLSRINNEMDTVQFSLKKASKLVKAIGRKMATDRCIMFFLFLIAVGIVAIIIVKIVHPNDRHSIHIPGSTPPAARRRLLLSASDLH